MVKVFEKLILTAAVVAFAVALSGGCTSTPVETPAPVSKAPEVSPKPVPPPPASEDLFSVNITPNNGCDNYHWPDVYFPKDPKKARGVAPAGGIYGIMLSYKKALLRNQKGLPYGTPAKDALAHYGLGSGNELLKTYTFLIGLCMRESNCNYTLGRDYTAKGEQNSATAEVGMWQFSYDSIGNHPDLRRIYEYYKANPKQCMSEVYGMGLCSQHDKKCPRHRWIRTDGYITQPVAGFEFQKFMRSCPQAQIEYAAILIRVNRLHFGPINRKEVEYVKACENMLKNIK